jgi:hypothetical protein
MDPEELEKAMSEFETKLADALVRINEAGSLENEEDRAHLITLTCFREHLAAVVPP